MRKDTEIGCATHILSAIFTQILQNLLSVNYTITKIISKLDALFKKYLVIGCFIAKFLKTFNC
jgi:hypothetical protein